MAISPRPPLHESRSSLRGGNATSNTAMDHRAQSPPHTDVECPGKFPACSSIRRRKSSKIQRAENGRAVGLLYCWGVSGRYPSPFSAIGEALWLETLRLRDFTVSLPPALKWRYELRSCEDGMIAWSRCSSTLQTTMVKGAEARVKTPSGTQHPTEP